MESPSKPPETSGTEDEYLRRQAELARRAIRQTLEDFKDSLKTVGSPKSYIVEHPLISLAAGIGLGTLAGVLIFPSRDQTFREKYGPLLEKIKPGKETEREEAPGLFRRTIEKQELYLRSPSLFKIGKTLLAIFTRVGAIALAIGRRYAQHASGNGN